MEENFQKFYESKCQSKNRQCKPIVVIKRYSESYAHYITQCQNCGDKFGQPIAKRKLNMNEPIPSFNDDLYEKCMEERNRPFIEHQEKQRRVYKVMKSIKHAYYKSILGIEFDNFDNFYKKYLLSDIWKEKKFLRETILFANIVMKKRQRMFITINYSNVGNESDFDLISLCHHCHLSLYSYLKILPTK